MNLKLLLPYLTLCILINSCKEQKNNSTTQSLSYDNLKIDTGRYVLFTNGDSHTLSIEDVQKIYSVIQKCVDSLNLEVKEPYKIDIRRYRFQISYLTDHSNTNVVWVNSFCDKDEPNWRKEIVSVKDGGHCFFNFKIDLKTLTFFDLFVNGSA